MRRIDLLCKLFGPLFIALLDGYSTKLAIVVNLGTNVISLLPEYFAIANVYHLCPPLQRPKLRLPPQPFNGVSPSSTGVRRAVEKIRKDFALYVHHAAFLPSFAGALLYLTVLSFAGQMVTYLLSAGYDSTQIAVARTLSVGFEVLATWVAPWLMATLGSARAGLWLSSWQAISLASGTTVFVAFKHLPLVSASGLVLGTVLSRVGLRGFDLCVQLILQEVCR